MGQSNLDVNKEETKTLPNPVKCNNTFVVEL